MGWMPEVRPPTTMNKSVVGST